MPGTLWLLLLATASNAREIVFPPVNNYQATFQSHGLDELDLSSAKYAGLTTFANLPYLHCLSKDESIGESYDIAILGAPFDTVGIQTSTLLRHEWQLDIRKG